jgi:fumarate hydratase subunit beta
MDDIKQVQLPLSEETIASLRAGDQCLLTGVLYTGRDAAHKRMIETLARGEKLPFDVRGQVIYYTGPAPARPHQVIGSAGPTTAGRMDAYTPQLLELGLKGMIGKGERNQAVKDSLRKNKGLYFAAIGGLAAVLAKRIVKVEMVAYEELGTEAIRRLEVKDFPVTVINDIYGGDCYQDSRHEFEQA